jgi:hypothetical protein
MNEQAPRFNFATIISQEYLIKGVSFHRSLENRVPHFHVWICCMDDTTYDTLLRMKLANATLVNVKEIENDELLQIKRTRKLYEYCWTIKASFCLYVLDLAEELDHIIYCDSDMFFFADPQPLHEEWGSYSVFLCTQRGTDELERWHGHYQAGFIGFKRDEQGIRALQWWNKKCIEKCADHYDESWGDQKYLEYIPLLFTNIKIIDHIGIDAAPWNLIMNNQYAVSGTENDVFLDDSRLIAFHFGSLLILNEHQFELWKLEPLPFMGTVIRHIYTPYLENLQASMKRVTNVLQTDISHLYAAPPGDYRPKNFLEL